MGSDDYDGPKKPRKDTRFKEGASGNPRGRPRKEKTPAIMPPFDEKTKMLLRKEAERVLQLPDGVI